MTDSADKQYRRFTAYFEPQRTDDLKPGSEQFIGLLLEWQYAWVIEDGPYEGQWACSPEPGRHTPFVWVPESDLRHREGPKP